MGCSISYEREPEAEIVVEGHDLSSPYHFECNIWCGGNPSARQVNHDQLPNNEPVDIMLDDLTPVSQPTPQDEFAAEWQETGGRAVAQQARQEPMAGAERSHHQISSRTHLPNSSSAHLELVGLENRLLQLREEQGSRERSLSPWSQSEIDRLRRQIWRVGRALEHPAQFANSEHERRIRHGRARPLLASPAPSSRLRSDIENGQQPINQGDRREPPNQRPSTPYPQLPNSPPPAYSIRTPE